MRWLRTITRELVGLVVDDVGFAAAIVAWIACSWVLFTYVLPPMTWHPVMLFGGVALILLESVVRRTRARQ